MTYHLYFVFFYISYFQNVSSPHTFMGGYALPIVISNYKIYCAATKCWTLCQIFCTRSFLVGLALIV